MSRWITPGSSEWPTLFTGFERTAYRLECQQMYASPTQDAGLANFLAGKPIDVDWTFLRETSAIQRAKGATLTKVRVVVEPQTQYTQLELTLYPIMAQIGEDIHILTVQQGDWPDGVPHQDYWLFDERDLWRMHYHENFRFKGAELIEDEHAVADAIRARDVALDSAVPLAGYLAQHPEILEHTST